MIGVIPVVEGAVLAPCCVAAEPPAAGQRDLGRLALVAGAALAFVTVAIPLQLKQQWITIGWALEGAALAWLYRRIPHRGLFYSGDGAARRGVRPARAQPRGPRLRAARRDAHPQLVSLHLSALRGGDARRGVVPVEDRTIGLPVASAASRRCLPAPASSCSSCCSTSRSPTTTPPDRRSCSGSASTRRAGPHLHDRLADLRHGAARGRHLAAAIGRRASPRSRSSRSRRSSASSTTGSLEGLYRVASFVGLASRWRWCRSRCRSTCSEPRSAT